MATETPERRFATSGEPPESDIDRVLGRYAVAEALADAGFGDVLVLSHESADRALTPTRRGIVEALTTGEFDSQRQLAEHLDRDPGNVKRDLDVLCEEGVVARETEGRAKRPVLKYDTVTVEPVVSGREPTK